jgi:GT2 family glycosyltransferase
MQLPGFEKDIADIRNRLVVDALNDGCTHLLTIDTDQVYPKDTIKKLMAHDLDIVGGVIHRRYPPFEPILKRWDIEKENYVNLPDEICYSGDLVEVDATGCGCLLMKTEIFLNMEDPWFAFSHNHQGYPIGEDINFCKKAKEAGYRVFVDTSIQIDHLTQFSVNRGLREVYKKLNRSEKNGTVQ